MKVDYKQDSIISLLKLFREVKDTLNCTDKDDINYKILLELYKEIIQKLLKKVKNLKLD